MVPAAGCNPPVMSFGKTPKGKEAADHRPPWFTFKTFAVLVLADTEKSMDVATRRTGAVEARESITISRVYGHSRGGKNLLKNNHHDYRLYLPRRPMD